MIGESLAIVCVILVMTLMYRRAGKKMMAGIALPLICVPCARLLSIAILGMPSEAAGNLLFSYIFIITGLVACVALCTWASRGITSNSVRTAYLLVSFVFSGALAIAYIL